MLALRLRVGQRLAYLGWARHRRAVDIENDVSPLQALLGCHAIWINCRNDDAFSIGIVAICRREHDTQMEALSFSWSCTLRLCLVLAGHLA